MNNLAKNIKISVIFAVILGAFVGGLLSIYLWLIPYIVANQKFINFVETKTKEVLGANLTIDAPELHTSLTPTIKFKVNRININKNDEQILELEKLNSAISFRDIIIKRIIIKRLSVESFFVDVNRLLALFPQEDNKKQDTKFDWDIDVMDALLYARNVEVIYDVDKATHVHILSKGFGTNNARKVNRRVYFNILFDITRNNENIKILLKDQAKVIISKKTLYINDLPVVVNNSRFFIKAIANRKIKYRLNVYANNFDVANVVKLINSNLLVPNGKEMLEPVATNITGSFNFDVNLTPKKFVCSALLNKLRLDFIPLNNLPITVNGGNILVDDKTIKLKDFKGYYCDYTNNKIDFAGDIYDYMKTMQMNITANALVTDEFMHHHLSKLIGYPLNMVGVANTRLIIKSKNNKFDLTWLFRLAPGQDLLVDGMSISHSKLERVLKADMHFENMLLKIKSIDYFLTYMKDNQWKRKSIMYLTGNVDCNGAGKLLDLGLNVPDPLPSEFFNIFVRQKFFKKGTISGHIKLNNRGKYPVLVSNMVAEGIRIPSQRLKITKATVKTDDDHIHVDANGRFKRSAYTFHGNIENRLLFPIIVNHVNLTIDNMDLAKLLESFNQQNTEVVANQPKESDNENDDAFVFNTGLIIVNDCNLNLVKANFNDIKMGNLHALLTLDKNGLLQVQSNKFDFAEGISTLKLRCDLMKHKYYVRLGVKDVNSDLIASSLLNLSKEISGKAKGLIELETDDSLKLNGQILFAIENGTIGKVGFLEYVLKFASLFRNPMAMLSPSTFVDLVNIPDGNFDNIKGELHLKNNVIELIKIRSKSPQLSSFIVGRFDLDSRDAILRIYTKMSNRHKGFYGVLRNISLNALANRIPLGNSNETNYYSAEIKQLPQLDVPEKDCQIFLTKVDGDVEHNNFISSLKRIK